MKIFGYITGDETLRSLKEATIQADLESIRSLASFLTYAADMMEKNGGKFGHVHYRDFVKNPPRGADLIVARVGDD
jgi:hypothetical protein